jgi:thiamine transport system substrate-binding protein
MVLSYTTSPAYHIIDENKTEYKSLNFEDGHYGQVEVAAMLKSSKNKQLSREFLKFMHSDEFQDIIPTGNWGYPVKKTKKGLPKGFETLYIPKKMYLMDGSYEKRRKLYIDEWLKAVR